MSEEAVPEDVVAKVAALDLEWYATDHCDYDHYLETCAECRKVAVRSIIEGYLATR